MLYVSAFRRFFSYKVVSQGMLLLWFALFLCGQELVAQISAPARSVVVKPTKSIQQGSATVKKGGGNFATLAAPQPNVETDEAIGSYYKYVPYVNPFIGTGGHGHTFPGATVPFGMVQLSPDTRNDASWDGCGGYHYDDSFVYGFSHAHLSGTGVSDWGDVLVMPISSIEAKKMDVIRAFSSTEALNARVRTWEEINSDSAVWYRQQRLLPTEYRQPLDHAGEQAEAGYYRCNFNTLKCRVELSSGDRVGYHRYTFQQKDTVYFLIDLQHRDKVLQKSILPVVLDQKNNQDNNGSPSINANIVGNRRLEGYRFSKAWADNQQLYFAMEFNSDIVSYRYSSDGNQLVVGLIPAFDNQVLLAVGISQTSIIGAWANLFSEMKVSMFGQKPFSVEGHFIRAKMQIAKLRRLYPNPEDQWLRTHARTETTFGWQFESTGSGLKPKGLQFYANAGAVVGKSFSSKVDSVLQFIPEIAKQQPSLTWSFDDKKQFAQEKWELELSKIKVDRPLVHPVGKDMGGWKALESPGDQKNNKLTIFYTALYHTMIHPSLCSDVLGWYAGRGEDALYKTDLTEDLKPRYERKVRIVDHDVYNVYSLWDTYRALHPLLTLIDAPRTLNFIRSMMLQYEDAGRLPVWELSGCETNCMIGYHSVSVIADAWMKGLRDLDDVKVDQRTAISKNNNAKRWLQAMVVSARKDHNPSTILGDSLGNLGYYGIEHRAESVSKILEYAYDDWCIARMAEDLNVMDVAKEFYQRSERWRNVFDASIGFMRPRTNGGWHSPFDPREVNNHYTEANAWQYSMYVPHDAMGLIDALGGEKAGLKHLDSLFGTSSETTGRDQADISGLIGQYAHGNEPSHHLVYLYNYLGKPIKAQSLINRICYDFYKNAPDGLIGNEDCGQMSAWYVMSAMGLYMIAPGSNLYATGSPQFGEIVLNRSQMVGFNPSYDRKSSEITNSELILRVAQDANGTGNPLAVKVGIRPEGGKGISADASDFTNLFVGHSDLLTWDALVFVPVAAEQRDKMLIKTVKQNIKSDYAPGVLLQGNRVYQDSHTIAITPLSNWGGRLTLRLMGDGLRNISFSEKAVATRTFQQAWTEFEFLVSAETFYIHHYGGLTVMAKLDSTIMVSGLPGSRKGGTYGSSDWTYGEFNPIPNNYSIKLSNKYQAQYTGGGDRALLDGIRGGLEWRAGGWQGYYNKHLIATIDMGESKSVKRVSIGFLQDSKAWIIFPKYVEVKFSKDGIQWTNAMAAVHNVSAMDERVQTLELDFQLDKNTLKDLGLRGAKANQVRYIMLVAEPYGALPKEHLGYPYQGMSHLFADEITIELNKKK